MKKVFSFLAVAAAAFILASCNLPSLNKGQVEFSMDDAAVSRIFDTASKVAGDNYPVTIEVNIHGRLELSQSKVITSKDDVTRLDFSFDIPKNIPSDVEVLITIDKSVVLYRGVTKNVRPNDIGAPVQVALDQVFEIKPPKIVTSLKGKETSVFRGDEFEIHAVAEDGTPYPDFINTEFMYNPMGYSPESGIDSEKMVLTGSRIKKLNFNDFDNRMFDPMSVTAKIAGSSIIPGSNSTQIFRQLRSKPYKASNSYLIVHPSWGTRVFPSLSDIPSTYTDWQQSGTYLSNARSVDFSFDANSRVVAVAESTSGVSNFVQDFIYDSFYNKYKPGGCTGYGGDYGYHTFEDGRGTIRSIVIDHDSEKKYLIGRQNEKNVIYQCPVDPDNGYPKYTLPFDDDITTKAVSIDACVYDDKLYLIRYDKTDALGEYYLYVYQFGDPCVELKAINLRALLPRYSESITNYNTHSSSFRYANNPGTNMDIIAWEDKVYVLYNELGTKYVTSNASTNGVSRGAVIEIDPATLSVSHIIGWTDKPTGNFIYEKYDQNYGTLRAKSPRLCPDGKESMEGFFGPQRIVGLKPKKLIIQDTGEFVYVENDTIQGEKVNRIVEVNLETFSIDKVDQLDSIYNTISTVDPSSYVLDFYEKAREGGSDVNSNSGTVAFEE